jgi:glycogen(starch) synthase
MRILEVTHRYPPALGGVEIQVEAIARGLVGRGHSVEVVTTDLARDRPLTRLPTQIPAGAVSVRRHRAIRTFPAPHGLGLVAPGMALDLLRTPADVVHAHAFGMAPTWMAAFARRRTAIPLVVETHVDGGRGTPGWWTYARAVARATLAPADRVVAHTGLETDLLVALGVPRPKVARIPNGIDLDEFADLPPRPRGAEGVALLFVGRLYPEQKGLEPLVRAVARVPSSVPLALRIVGEDWGGRDLVLRLAREGHVEGRVTLTGPLSRPDLLAEYARADVLVLPSLFDCTPIVLMEAMAASLPIIASHVGGIPEVVTEGEDAILCPPNDPDALAEAFQALARDPTTRARLGATGRRNVERFSWDRVLPLWIDLFDQVVRAGS